MRLTQWTDYALRLLMYCAVHQQRERPITISEVAQVHNISRSHLTKIVQDLAGRGLESGGGAGLGPGAGSGLGQWGGGVGGFFGADDSHRGLGGEY